MADYYVKWDGNDGNAGTSDALAKLTWASVLSLYSAGDTVYYYFPATHPSREQVDLPTDGAAGNTVKIRPYNAAYGYVLASEDASESVVGFKWNLSASGTGEYYVTTEGGTDPFAAWAYVPWSIGIVKAATWTAETAEGLFSNNENQSFPARKVGTVGSLAKNTCDRGDNDGLGFSTFYVRLADGFSIANDHIELNKRDYCFRFSAETYIDLIGMKCAISNIFNFNMQNSNQNNDLSMTDCHGRGSDNNIIDAGNNSLVRLSNHLFNDCTFGHSSVDNVFRDSFTDNTALINCEIFGLNFPTKELVLLNNCINSIVSHNKIYDGQVASGSSDALRLTTDCDDAYIANNLIYDFRSDGIAMGGTNSGLRPLIYNNIVYNNINGDGIDTGTGVTGHKIKNNIVHTMSDKGYEITDIAGQDNNKNISYNNGAADVNLNDANVLTTDPMFVDPANGDFRLLPGSPAINSGETIAAVTDDIVGVSRPQGSAYDRGAYEFTAAQISEGFIYLGKKKKKVRIIGR